MVDTGAEATAAKIKLTIRQSNGEQFEVEVDPAQTVLQLKELCKDKTQLEAASQRLIFKGKLANTIQETNSHLCAKEK